MKARRGWCVWAGMVAAVLAGCLRIQEAVPLQLEQGGGSSPTREPVPQNRASIWPQRWSKSENVRGAIIPMEGTLADWVGVRLGEDHYLRSAPEDASDAAAVAKVARMETGYQYVLEGPGAFVFRKADRFLKGRSTSSRPDAMFRFVSGRPMGKTNGVEVVMIERTWFGYYDAGGGMQRRGLIVMVPGLFGVPEPVNDRFVELCVADGWAVLRMLAHPSRFTERTRFPIEFADMGASAQRIADELGQRAAEVAYAAQAGVRHVHEIRPEIAKEPHVLIGMSGGAMAGPTVHALEPDAYDAVVLVAGGTNFLMINEESNYAGWVQAIRLDWGVPFDRLADGDKHLAELSNAYMERAPLDGYHLAALVRGKPVLVLQGSADKAVPSRFGDQLWERLGQPERWMFAAGHELLFLTLNNYTPSILKWLDEHLGTGKAATGEARE
ncbi:MAG: hypothetical protein KJZ65_02485 [Phycisphaerales bacterium]|nr:hypothetical protein [Phycisphaerales bacterium]